MNVYERTVKTRLSVKVVAQIFLFQTNTLSPSNMPKGMRLKRAIQALKAAPVKNNDE